MPTVIGAIRDKWIQLGGATSFHLLPRKQRSTMTFSQHCGYKI